MNFGRIIYLHALSSIHSGTGQSAAVIDLPIAREKATGWPLIPASSFKGVLRDLLQQEKGEEWARKAFGTTDASGALCFGDQRILCLPVRSFFGTFAYVTCPLALQRFHRDVSALGLSAPFDTLKLKVDSASILTANNSHLAQASKVYLEDLDFDAKQDTEIEAIAQGLASALFPGEESAFTSRFAIVSDDVFAFLSETATEVAARVRLEEGSKTVAGQALWYEESVPAEAIFAGPVILAENARRNDQGDLLDVLTERVIQVGGKSSVGRGLCRMVVKP